MSSPSESSTKRCAYPHRSSEDYSPSSCFRSPEPSRRAQLVEHFDVPITLLVELPERICRKVSFTEAEFDWLQSFPGKLVPLASTSHVHRYIAIYWNMRRICNTFLQTSQNHPMNDNPKTLRYCFNHKSARSLCSLVPPRWWRLHSQTVSGQRDLNMNPHISRRPSSR